MAETTIGVQASGATNATCAETGPYRSARNARITVFIRAGDRFPVDADGANTTWTLVVDEDGP